MKKSLPNLIVLLLAVTICSTVTAQSRLMKYYISDDGIQNQQPNKNAPNIFLQSSLSGYYFEGFENTFPPAGWQVIDVLDTATGWNSSVTADFPAAYDGMQSAYCRYEFATPSSGESWLITPKFTVASGDSLSFQFKLEYFGFAPDSTFILVSTTDSALSSFTTVLDFYAEGLNYPTDTSNWYYKTYSLSAFAGQDIYIAFKNKNDEGDGLFIDNVELGTRPAAEASVQSIDMDVFHPSGTSNPKATVKNNGGSTQTFNVAMNISGGYSSTKSVTISPQATTQITFDPWNAAIGNYTINVQTLLTGDANPANDTLSASIKVLEPFVNYGWSTHDPLVIPTFGSAVASVNNSSSSRLFALGGYGNLTIIPDAFDFDMSFNTWAGISPMLTECTFAASATANGKIFVFGGRTLTTAAGPTQIYDYTTDTWTLGTPMPQPVLNAAFATYKDSLVYIVGGSNDATGQTYNLVQVYNAYTDTWAAGTPKPGPAVYGIRGGIVQNKLVIAGGYNPVTGLGIGTTYVGEIDTINPTQINWIQVADHPAGKISRQGSAVSVDKNSSLVVFAGGSFADQTTDVTGRTFAYDVNSNSWKLGPAKPSPRNLFYMAPVIQNDSIYLVALGGNPGSWFHSEENEWLNMGYYQFPTGMAEHSFDTEGNLFPNPANASATLLLNLKTASQVNISIVDVLGNEMLTVSNKSFVAGKNSIHLPTAQLASGVYFCVINIDGKTFTKKLFKN